VSLLRPAIRLLIALPFVVLATTAAAQGVVPSERVTSRVILRAEPTTAGADAGSLRPGERARLLAAGADGHQVALADGTEGFVSAAWTVLVPNAWDVAARPPEDVPAKHADRFAFAPEATLSGGAAHTETLVVDFEPVPREQRMAEELADVREENATLIDEIKEKLRAKLAREMAAVRDAAGPGQEKELEVSVER